MKHFLGIFFLVSVNFFSFGQDSTSIIGKEIKIISDFGANVYGGIDKGIAWLGQVNVSLDIPTEKLKLWENGEFYFHYMSTFGKSFSQYSGDLQVVSNIEAQHVATFMELWYAHQFNKFQIKAGIIDLNANFAYTDHSLQLINSSFGIQPTISANMPVPIFPVTALGGILSFEASHSMNFSVGVFDGNPSIRTPFQPLPDFNVHHSEGFFAIGELEHIHRIKNRQGSLKLGAWIHSNNFDDHHKAFQYGENIGGYFILDQQIFSTQESEIYTWAKMGYAPRECNIVRYFYGGGLTVNNVLFPIPLDNISFGVAHAVLCNHLDEFKQIGDANETALELTFQKSFNFFCIQPDIQYIINPSGIKERPNALFAILRCSLTF